MGSDVPVGKGVVIRDGTDITIVASGIMVQEAQEVEGSGASIINMFAIKSLDAELL